MGVRAWGNGRRGFAAVFRVRTDADAFSNWYVLRARAYARTYVATRKRVRMCPQWMVGLGN